MLEFPEPAATSSSAIRRPPSFLEELRRRAVPFVGRRIRDRSRRRWAAPIARGDPIARAAADSRVQPRAPDGPAAGDRQVDRPPAGAARLEGVDSQHRRHRRRGERPRSARRVRGGRRGRMGQRRAPRGRRRSRPRDRSQRRRRVHPTRVAAAAPVRRPDGPTASANSGTSTIGGEVSLAVRGRTILVAGEPGTGKSWLAGLLCEQLDPPGVLRVRDRSGGRLSDARVAPGRRSFLEGTIRRRTRAILLRALRYPDVSVVIDLSKMSYRENERTSRHCCRCS